MRIWIDGYEANQKNRVGSGQFAYEVIKNLEKIENYRGSNLIKIMLKSKILNKNLELLKKIKNVSNVKEENNELLVYIKDEKLVKETVNNILNYVDFVNIRVGREIEDIFK